uniref:NADH-ubiquinone oxidoreductase chain 3 n=1 Tax=Thyasira tokunagai TaxID=3055801 RepID=A0AB39CCD8_9BIVA
MMSGMSAIMISLIFSVVFLLISSAISWRIILDREKLSSYECGFDPFISARSPFSLRFFLLAVIFLVFDVELVFLFPYIGGMMNSFSILNLIFEMIFLFILGWGLFHEWVEGSLEWKN